MCNSSFLSCALSSDWMIKKDSCDVLQSLRGRRLFCDTHSRVLCTVFIYINGQTYLACDKCVDSSLIMCIYRVYIVINFDDINYKMLLHIMCLSVIKQKRFIVCSVNKKYFTQNIYCLLCKYSTHIMYTHHTSHVSTRVSL